MSWTSRPTTFQADARGARAQFISSPATYAASTTTSAPCAQTVARFGKLDIFVGNTGVGDAFVELKDLAPDVIDEAFDEMFAVNVKGYLLGAKAALPELVASGGCMIFTLSNSSFLPDGGGTALRREQARMPRARPPVRARARAPRIRVNAVAPGGTGH